MMAYTVVLLRRASEYRVSPRWMTYRIQSSGGPQESRCGGRDGRKISMPATSTFGSRQLACTISLMVAPELMARWK
jgi:hypothetical protein